jgi:hypothetical protein
LRNEYHYWAKDGIWNISDDCFSCSENDIKISVYYIFHLAKKIQDAELAEKEKNIE